MNSTGWYKRAAGLACIGLLISLCQGCEPGGEPTLDLDTPGPRLHILGIAQDAGYPQIGCEKDCCKDLWDKPEAKRTVTCLGLIDPRSDKHWMFEATPDMKFQSKRLSDLAGNSDFKLPNGIFLTHGHIGHYTGLMHLGREALYSDNVPVYTMPRMKHYLRGSGPWNQLYALENIALFDLAADTVVPLASDLKVIPFLVPHRGEYTETVGYRIEGPNKSALFIPDIDKWEQWKRSIVDEIRAVDFAFLDGTFYRNGEVGNRDMSEIPHPFIEESVKLFEALNPEERSRVYFIHFNHTNPVMWDDAANAEVEALGYRIAEEGMVIGL